MSIYDDLPLCRLQKSGIQFKKHEEEGIEVNDFAEALMTSGVVLSEQASPALEVL